MHSFRFAVPLLVLVSAIACARDEAPAAATPGTAAPSATTDAPAGGSWQGEVTGGYTGNRIAFTLADGGARIADIVFTGHWDCADGIETTTSGPSAAFPVSGGRIAIESAEPPGGGATATRFVMNGQLAGDSASGTLRVNINALGCDTRELSWSAAPASR